MTEEGATSGGRSARTEPARPARGATLRGPHLACLYLTQGLVAGLIFGTLPVAMRQTHVTLVGIALVSLGNFPAAGKFLIAPWVDRFVLAPGRRRAPLVALQGLIVATLVALSR